MPLASWPASLPDSPLVEGYQEKAPNLLIRQEVDQGPARVRRRCASRPWPMSATFILTKAEAATLETFAYTTLQGGALPFNWTHPRTGAAIDMRIVPGGDALYTLAPAGSGVYWRASVALEVLP